MSGKNSRMEKSMSSKFLYHTFALLVLQFLIAFAQGQGPGNTICGTAVGKEEFSVSENKRSGTLVGTITTQLSYTYAFKETQTLFSLNSVSGEIRTLVQIDRESIATNPVHILVVRILAGSTQECPIEVFITVLDENDNSPVFHPSSVQIKFKENVQIGYQVPIYTATDIDSGKNGIVSNYNIHFSADSADRKFSLIQIDNIPYIKTIDKLDREEKESYQLNISCQDNGDIPRSGFLQVNIVITDYNDNSPQFNPSQFVASINISAAVGTLVIKVEASDEDIGANGDITYRFIDESDQFKINEKTGEITTTKTPLNCFRRCDRSTNNGCQPTSCVLTIEVEDGGRPSLKGRAYVTINVKDENNNSPTMKISYKPDSNTEYSTVDENAANFTVVATVSVSDKDQGNYGKISSVKIVGGNGLGHFTLHSFFNFRQNLVVVNGVRVLDRERISQYNLTLMASDGGTPSRTSLQNLVILVRDVNDHYPFFERQEYLVSISESTPVGSYVIDLVAKDLDTGVNAKLTYAIISGNEFGWFKISPDSGLVTTKASLHYDVSSQVVMNISVHDGSLSPFYNYTVLIVNIWDENDITPTFEHGIYNASIREGLNASTEVITLRAVDHDNGLNGTVVYSLHQDVSKQYPDTFDINQNTGRLQTRKVLDREQIPDYVIKVIARDGGKQPLSSTATVSISVTDVNDNRPAFYPETYYASVLENKEKGTSVAMVTAVDPDEGENGRIKYYFITSTSDFIIDQSTAIIRTNKILNRESRSSYTLRVQARDNDPTHTAPVQAVVQITVSDQIDNVPVFKNTPYSFNIREDGDNSPPTLGRNVGKVSATSVDSNAIITYMIADGDPSRVFTINQESGVITTKSKVDREKTSRYILKIMAKAGSMFSNVDVKITVNDVNDNKPKFSVFTIETYVIENWPIGHDIYLAAATDADSGVNSVVSYTLQTTSDFFRISGGTGMIYLAKPIDKSSVRDFNMVVTATDSGTPQLSTTVNVHLTVQDVNDHTPVFEHSNYEKILNESMSVNSVFFQLTATDQDLGQNGEIMYNITFGNADGKFGIFPDGKIYIAQKLDRETKDRYKLTIMAKDQAVEPRSSSANISVTIQDDNDNKPVFKNASYVFKIAENISGGNVVGSVKAEDADIGRNAELSYYLDQGNFTVNIQTGEITSSRSFDREEVANYTFSVTVMDNGLQRLSDSVPVTVHITDVNDNPPTFKESMYVASLNEDAPKYTPVIKLVATDSDTNQHAALSYTFVSGNDDDQFELNSGNGQITLNKALDRENQDTYVMIVKASDSGKPIFTSTTTVSINIADVNDNSPLFAQTAYEMQVLETRQPGDLIGSVTATDTDLGQNAAIRYTLTGVDNDGTFSLDKNTGKLYLNKRLDFEKKSMYMLNISAVDKGLQPLSQYVRLTIRISDTNDNAPSFINTPSLVIAPEDLKLFKNVVKISASDPDDGKNGELVYSIKNQDPSGDYFGIKKDTGEIYLSRPLDREVVSSFKLSVVASDQADVVSSRKSTEMLMTVDVRDVNDNDPSFRSMNAIIVNYPTSQGLVSTVVAEDPDFGPNGTVVYELSQGDRSSFRLESSSGKLHLLKNLPQNPVTYSLRVTARDSGIPTPRSSYMDITVILVSNSGGPEFLDTPYSGQIQENVKSDHSILQVKTKPTSKSKEYYITEIVSTKSAYAKHFKIDKSSGIISTSDILDRELHGGQFRIKVCAMERQNDGPKASITEVIVNVTDVNDTPPKFSQSVYSVSVLENITIGDQVTRVNVSDDDLTGSLFLSIVQGNEDGKFSINQNGIISTSKSLDRETNESYDLKIQAFDGVNTSQCTVNVNILDVNDEVPTFTNAIYTFDLEEDMAVGTTINRVEAVDNDLGANGEVTYTLVSQWAHDVFQLDRNQGIFTLNKNLDFEQVQLYILKVKASDGGNPSKSSTVTVYMNVKDINDNIPTFDPSSYSAKVSENVSIDTSVLTVSATDRDSGVNSQVKYSIIKGDKKHQFSVNPDTGVVTNIKSLDREDIPFYILEIMATDQAEPPVARHSAYTQITVIVQDVNDNDPEFISPSEIWIKENTAVDAIAFYVQAADKDSGTNRLLSYTMQYNSDSPFRIGRVNGEMLVNKPLDREKVFQYILVVTATDNGSPARSAVQTLTVNIKDVNDNSPVFLKQEYLATVPENVAIGKTLLTVQAKDDDEGLNGLVRYFIIGGEDNSDFSVDQSSGVLRVKKSLDYERKKSYDFTIQAEDSGADTQYSTTNIKITVTDINDNAPVFLDSPFEVYVMENSNNLPVRVTQVSARDDDSPPYNNVAYSFLDGNEENIFQINERSGEITCHKVLDREVKDRYTLVVRGKDFGHPGPLLTGTGTVIVTVADVNDNSPVFEHNGVYTGHILENRESNVVILTVKATDQDAGSNAQITYRLENSINNKFTIHPNSGQIVAQQRLDREETDQSGNFLEKYTLQVIAADRGSHPRVTVASVTIYVDDVNDNSPMFEKQSYSQTINNPTQSGEFVIGVTALDRDTGLNGQIEYSLTGTDSDKFTIDTTRGIITTKQAMTTGGARFTCKVIAKDKGNSSRSSDVPLIITVSNSNSNNKPVFSNQPSPLKVTENVRIGKRVTTVMASSPGGRNIRFSIVGGNVGQGFSIGEDSGVLTVANEIDYEMTTDFQLWIEAKDDQTPPQFSTQRVNIYVEDVNDNTPRFVLPLYQISISENLDITKVIKVVATDRDSGDNGKLTYSIQSGNPNNNFTIVDTTGQISTRTKLDREKTEVFNLIIQAVDHGVTPHTGSTTVKVKVTDLNDNPPKFNRQFSAQINEDTEVGRFVLQVTTSDADIGINANVTYSLTHDKFAIDRHSGNISVKNPLDIESMQGQKFFLLSVRATDGSYANDGTVTIFIKDVNDEKPEFMKNSLSFQFPERRKVGSPIGTVTAKDKDFSQPNNQVYYSLKYPSSELEINSMNGDIKSKVEMVYIQNATDRYLSNLLEVVVIATDLGTPPLSSEAVVKVHIVDANDHAPVFEKDGYFSAVPLTVQHGDSILKVVAKDDLDVGINAEIDYYLDGGNGSGYFSVEKSTGYITVAAELQSTQQNQVYIVNVRAEDRGSPSMSAVVEVKLQITGDNKFAPEFVTTVFQKTIAEDTKIGTEIAAISAKDKDKVGPNGRVSYQIISGNEQNLFYINSQNGALSVKNGLDYETVKIHHLNITVRDTGLLFKEVSAIFTVILTDVNDNPPLFKQTEYEAFIPENAASGDKVIQVTAEDADKGSNAIISYSLVATTIFTIEANSGIIRLQGSLDYETKPSYTILVMALNPGTQQKSTTNIKIQVTGINEFYPVFVQKQYSFSIKESAKENDPVGSVLATDKDHGEDGVVYYYLVGSSNTLGFKINYETGLITVSGKPDYESSPIIKLNVLAKNWGSVQGNDTNQCVVIISVQDANDAPVFSKALYTTSVIEDSRGDVSVITVSATDNDHKETDKQFTFTILGGNVNDAFKIDTLSGLVETSGMGLLDRETQPLYNLTVGAIDTGAPPQTGSALVQITLSDINDNAPYFQPSRPSGEVQENLNPGASVMTLSEFTFDLDLPPNTSPYTYQNHIGIHNNFFSISPNTGLVQTKVIIDREKNPDFIVPVVVFDNGSPKKSATLTFQVIIRDINDEPPTARDLTVQVTVLEGKYPSTIFANVRPEDKDIIGDYRCSIPGEDYGKFEIVSGCDLRLKSITSMAPSYTLNIHGSDGSTGSPNVSYDVNVSFLNISNDAVDNTVILKVQNLSPGEFVALKYRALKAAIEGLFSSDHMAVLYHVGADSSDVHVYVAVQTPSSGYVVPDILKAQITSNRASIQSSVKITMIDIGFSVCMPAACNNGKGGECISKISVRNSLVVADSMALVVTSPEFQLHYNCNCYPEFSGDDCSVPVSPCGSDHCKNGGKCVSDSKGDKICQCVSGWQGKFCDVDTKECEDQSFCKNGAKCENTEGSFICHCREGFSGDRCEIGSDNCQPNPCKNGATCRNEAFDFRCECPFTFWGKRCEKSTIGFEEGSYMEFDSLAPYYNDIDVIFTTNKDNSLLLYNPANSSSDFIALEIVNGYIRFSYKLDTATSTLVTIPKKVSTGDWFRVVVGRNKEKAIVKVSACPGDGSSCDECRESDNTCYGSGMQKSEKLDTGGQRLSIGGVKDISSITSRQGQVVTHDFIGCIRQFLINTVDIVRQQTLDQSKISNRCPREQGRSKCSPAVCNNVGTCVDEWSKTRCECQDGYTGPFCHLEYKPIGFGANSFVLFTQKDSYYRDQMVSQSNRKRRAPDSSSIFIRFRTTASEGLLFYAAQDSSSYAVLWINQRQLQYSIRTSGMETMESGVKVSDGRWYNVTVKVTGKTVSLTVDNNTKEQQMMLAFKFSDPSVTRMALGGYKTALTDSSLKDFKGCISKFKLDDSSLPLNGSTERFVVEPTSGVENGCSSLCEGKPCGDSALCSVDGEEVKCQPISGPGGADDELPISIGVIVVIAFFGVLILVIVVVFVICYVRRRKLHGKKDHASVKLNGSLHNNSKHYGNNSGHSHPDSGYGEHSNEDEFINSHIANQLHVHNHTNGQLNKPDIISSDQRIRNQLPLEIEDGTVIIDNGDAMQMHPMSEDTTEFYDIDATSSIAPSECNDVSMYYKGYRDGKPSYQHHTHLQNNFHHHKAHHKNFKHTESPLTVTGRNSVPLRNSPALRVNNSPAQMLDPALLHGSTRASPTVHGSRQSPMNHLISRQSPHIRASPLTHSARGTPHSDSVHHSRTDSEHSLASHHSYSSNSSVPRTAIVSNGHIKHGHRDRSRTGNHSNKLKVPQPRPVKGLTVEEVDKLNARPQRPSPESMIEAVSSSSGGQGRNRAPVDLYARHTMLEPPDSSSEESANDSFTCSEFEYENDRSRPDFDSEAIMFSKVPEVDENEDFNVRNENSTRFHSDGRNSNGDSFGSSEDGHSVGVKQFNGGLNWDDLLNWGPKFEKLVGVFRDIASLPDGDMPAQNRLVDTKNEAEEEYV